LKQLSPRRTHELRRSFRDADVDFHEQQAADADALHGLQIGRDPLATEVAVHHEPVDPGLGLLGRVEKLRREVRGRHCRDECPEPKTDRCQQQVHLSHGEISSERVAVLHVTIIWRAGNHRNHILRQFSAVLRHPLALANSNIV